MDAHAAEYGKEYLNYQMNRSIVRRMIRKLYLNNIKSFVIGNAVDYGCGSGELLSMLTAESVGFEINEVS